MGHSSRPPLWDPAPHPAPPGTHLETAPVLLDEVVIHSAHRPPVLVQHLRLPTDTTDSEGSLRETPPGPTRVPPQDLPTGGLPELLSRAPMVGCSSPTRAGPYRVHVDEPARPLAGLRWPLEAEQRVQPVRALRSFQAVESGQ